MSHGKSPPGIETISAKVPRRIRIELDTITERLNLNNRSDTIKLALNEFIDKQRKKEIDEDNTNEFNKI